MEPNLDTREYFHQLYNSVRNPHPQVIDQHVEQDDDPMCVEEKTDEVMFQIFSRFNELNKGVGINCSVPFDALNSIFSSLKFTEQLSCLQVCKSWSVHTPLFLKTLYFANFSTYRPADNVWKQNSHHLMTRPDHQITKIPVTFAPAGASDLDYLYFFLTDNNQLLEISNPKNTNEIKCRDLMTNEVIYSHTMKAPILELKLEGSKLFAIDEGKRFVCIDLQKPEDWDLPPHLNNIQFLNIKYEDKKYYILSEEKIVVKNEQSEIIDMIDNKNSKIVHIETTPNHIICQTKFGASEAVFALSKNGHKKTSLTLFRNIDYASICAVNGPYVIVSNTSHEVYLWKEEGDQFILQYIPKAILHHKAKPPTYTGWAPNPPIVKCYKEIVMFCYEGEIILWNIHSGFLLGKIKHDITDVVDFCTNGKQFFICGSQGAHALYDNLPCQTWLHYFS